MRADPVRSRLAHGPTVITAAVPGEAAAVYLRLAAGAADEQADEHGVAHFLEHMLFKGTPERGIGEAAQAIEGLGGDLNAYTSHDELVLHVEIAAGAWALALDVLADMVRASHLDAAEVDRERDVILEELASYEDDPDERLSETVQEALWGDHPYGRPVVGTEASVRALDVDRIRGFLHRELTAERVTLVVVGEVDHGEVLARAQALFADWPVGHGRRPVAPATVNLSGPRITRPPGTFDDRAIELVWPGPTEPSHPDLPALSVLTGILGATAGDRVTEILDEEPKAGFDGWADVFSGAFGGNIAVGFRPLPGHTEEALTRVLGVVDGISRACRGRWCARARETLLADLDFGEQTVDGIAEDMLLHETLHGDAAHRADWRESLAAVTPADVARVARRWLRPEAMVIGALTPEVSDAALLAAAQAARPAAVRRPQSAAQPIRTSIHDTPVLMAPANVPVVAVRVMAMGGALRIPERMAGLGAAWSRTIHRGAGRYDGEGLHDALDDLAAELQPTDGAFTLSLSATAPASHAADLLELMGELVLDPHFDEDEWLLVREELLDAVRSQHDHPRQVVAERAAALRFPGHPWRLPSEGTATSLGRIQGKAMGKLHGQHFVRGRAVVAVAGGIDPDDALAALGWLDDLPDPSEKGGPPPVQPWPALVPGVHEVRAGSRQAIVSLTGEGVSVETPERRGLELAEALLEGQSGRLFLALREKQALAYELWARSEERVGGGLFQLGLACDPARVEEASAGLRGVLEDLLQHPPDETELARARATILGREVLANQRVETRASRLGYAQLLGRDPTPGARRERLAATTVADVVAEVERVLAAGWLEVRSLPREGR